MTFYKGPDRLTVAPEPQQNESLRSWISRLSTANRTHPSDLFANPHLQRRSTRHWHSQLASIDEIDLKPISEATDTPLARLVAMRPNVSDLNLPRLSVFCPHCWRADLATETTPLFQRKQWCSATYLICQVHNTPLLDTRPMATPFDAKQQLASSEMDVFLSQQSGWQWLVDRFSVLQKGVLNVGSNAALNDVFDILDTIYTALARIFSPSPHYSGLRNLYFLLSESDPWKRYWHPFFADYDEVSTYRQQLSVQGLHPYMDIKTAAGRRLYWLVVSAMLKHMNNTENPYRRLFHATAWDWLEKRSQLWSKEDLRVAQDLAQLLIKAGEA